MSAIEIEFIGDVHDSETYVYDVNTLKIGKGEDCLELKFRNFDYESISVELSESDVENLQSLWSADYKETPVYSDGRVYWYIENNLVITELNGDLILAIESSTLNYQVFFDNLTTALWLLEKGELDSL